MGVIGVPFANRKATQFGWRMESLLIQRVRDGAYSVDRFGAGKGRFSLYLLVWEMTDSGTFFGKNIFCRFGGWIEAEIKKASTYICTESGFPGHDFGEIFLGQTEENLTLISTDDADQEKSEIYRGLTRMFADWDEVIFIMPSHRQCPIKAKPEKV